jgi:hypothetical protein
LAHGPAKWHDDKAGNPPWITALVADRDWNAAKNLERLAASSAASACGEPRSGAVRKSCVKHASKKQEPNGGGQLCAA